MNLTRTLCVSLVKNTKYIFKQNNCIPTLFYKSIDSSLKRTLNTIGTSARHPSTGGFIPPPAINTNIWIYKEEITKETPPSHNIVVDLPKCWWSPTLYPTVVPHTVSKIEAARLIVIRRRKMKKHKLRKLRKRMKFEWAKVRQRRELRKEKEFQAKLIAQIKDGEKFSAEQYVNEKIRQATEKPLPRFWKGKRLPAFIIRQKLGLNNNNNSSNVLK